jgi:hypothetical protein
MPDPSLRTARHGGGPPMSTTQQQPDLRLPVVHVCGHCWGNTTVPEVVPTGMAAGIAFAMVVCPPCAKQLREEQR